MKKISILLLFVLLILTSCSGSDAYQGKWKATDAKGKQLEINFEGKSFTVKDASGNSNTYSYSQNPYQYEDSVVIYGIRLSDGRSYQIVFPKNDDEGVALLKEESGNLIYIMGRTAYLSYDDVYGLDEAN